MRWGHPHGVRRPHCFFAIRRGKPSPYYCLGIWLCVRAKGTLRFVCGAHCFCGSPFAFYVQVNSSHRPAPKRKSVGVQPFGFGKGWSPSQGRNSASSNPKFTHIKRRKSVSSNTERTKPQIKKAACRKETTVHHSLHRKEKKCRASTLHAALTENSRP